MQKSVTYYLNGPKSKVKIVVKVVSPLFFDFLISLIKLGFKFFFVSPNFVYTRIEVEKVVSFYSGTRLNALLKLLF